MLAVIRARKSSISKVEECGSHEKHPRLLGRGRVKRVRIRNAQLSRSSMEGEETIL